MYCTEIDFQSEILFWEYLSIHKTFFKGIFPTRFSDCKVATATLKMYQVFVTVIKENRIYLFYQLAPDVI